MRSLRYGAAYFAALALSVALLSDAVAQTACGGISQPACPTPTPAAQAARTRRVASPVVSSGNSNLGLGVGLGTAGVALGIGIVSSMTSSPSSWRVPDNTIETGPAPPPPPRYRRVAQDDTEGVKPRRKKIKKIKATNSETPSTRSTKGPSIEPPAPPPVDTLRPGFTAPAQTETRYVRNEVLVVFRKDTTPAQIAGLEQTLGLIPLTTAQIALIGEEVRRYRLPPGVSVASTVSSLSDRSIVARAQPNYLFALQRDPAKPAAATDAPPVQYALGALHLAGAQKLATGKGVRIAIIDSGLDESNPDLKGAVTEHFDALGAPFKPHAHGTAIGGTIVAHEKLKGIAPEARLIAVRAFVGATAGANGTSFDILRGADYAAAHGARIFNMSFAGPEDPLLKSLLEAARTRGIVAIAAAGNGGPRAKPMFPAAEPGVIAVTATDAQGRPYARANRGDYIAVAAPGVDIIAPGLGDSVQITSGTSIAAAEASGVVALILERRPNATPEDIRKVLQETATSLSVEPSAGGAGLINAGAAVSPRS